MTLLLLLVTITNDCSKMNKDMIQFCCHLKHVKYMTKDTKSDDYNNCMKGKKVI